MLCAASVVENLSRSSFPVLHPHTAQSVIHLFCVQSDHHDAVPLARRPPPKSKARARSRSVGWYPSCFGVLRPGPRAKVPFHRARYGQCAFSRSTWRLAVGITIRDKLKLPHINRYCTFPVQISRWGLPPYAGPRPAGPVERPAKLGQVEPAPRVLTPRTQTDSLIRTNIQVWSSWYGGFPRRLKDS